MVFSRLEYCFVNMAFTISNDMSIILQLVYSKTSGRIIYSFSNARLAFLLLTLLLNLVKDENTLGNKLIPTVFDHNTSPHTPLFWFRLYIPRHLPSGETTTRYCLYEILAGFEVQISSHTFFMVETIAINMFSCRVLMV